jgi:DNA-nicking Smr family endonuclease
MTKARPPTDQAPVDEAFRAAVRDVRPLPTTALRVTPVLRKPAPRRRGATARHAEDAGATAPLPAATVRGEELLSYRKAGVRDQVARRLRRGQYPVESEIDLHGLSQAHARTELADFIAESVAAGLRCVRVIHGKGMRSGERGAVLKSAVNDWLRRDFDVVAFTSARPIDGGAGAVYVLLRG